MKQGNVYDTDLMGQLYRVQQWGHLYTWFTRIEFLKSDST